MPKQERPPLKVIGKVGSHDVVDFNGTPCLMFGKRLIGPTKIKDVLSDVPACKEFITRYDKEKPQNVTVALEDVKTKEQAEAAIQALKDKLAGMNASAGRVDPVQAQKAA